MHPKSADGMANSVDPDQTAPLGAVWSGSTLFAQSCLPKTYDRYGTLMSCSFSTFSRFLTYGEYTIMK